jgi:hypothetical protein
MALTCNAFASNTVGVTQRTAACVAPHAVNIGEKQLPPTLFLLLVLDSLERLRTNPGTIPALANIPACDAVSALANAYCALNLTNTPAFPVDEAQLQAEILYMLNEALCT